MNYRIYKLSKKEILKALVIYTAASLLVSYLFYDSVCPALLSVPMFFVYLKHVKKSCSKRKIEVLKNEFCEMIESLSDSLSAGFSIENAFSECRSDMIKLFGEDALIVDELEKIIKRNDLNSGVDAALQDFANRTDVEDINSFAIIFTEVRKNGGNLKEVIKKTSAIMKDKMNIENEIDVMLKGKVLEQKIMSVIPFIIIVFLRLTCGDFMDALYNNIAGICIMSLCLVIYAASIILSMKIVDITI